MNEEQGQEILDSRHATYGDRKKNMASMANMVNAYMDGVEIRTGKREMEDIDFIMMMVLYKIYRFAVTPEYEDNIKDIEGYARMAREQLGDSLIEAATAEEYQQKLRIRQYVKEGEVVVEQSKADKLREDIVALDGFDAQAKRYAELQDWPGKKEDDPRKQPPLWFFIQGMLRDTGLVKGPDTLQLATDAWMERWLRGNERNEWS